MCPSFIGILDIQSWWEVPSIAHFCSLFRAAFNLLDFDIEELEEALLTDGTEECASSLLTELIVRLLRGCLGNNDITASNYQMFLRRLFRQKCQETGHSNIFNADIDFQFLPLRRKVQILQALCDFRLAADDVFDLLKNLEAESLRVEPLGWDDNASAYWYFYGTRLYREDYVLKSKGKKRKTRDEFRYRQGEPLQVEERTDRVWQVVCFTEDDWIHLTDKFKESTSRVEKDLFLSLSENFLPEIPRLFQEKERLRRKRLLESMPRRTSSRVQIKNKQKEEDEQKQVVDENFKEDLDEKVQKKEIEQFERENRARQRELKRSQSCSSRSEKSRSPSLDDSSNLKHKKKIRHLRHNSDKDSTEDVSQAKPSGRQTNNSLACVTGQILIPDQKDHPNSTRKKVKTSQIFGSMEEEVQTDMYKVLKQLKTHEDAWPFMDPVEEEYAPNYYSVIRRPMDLQRMEDRLDQGFYTDFTKFQSDFNLIVNNCRLYNGQDNEYTEMVDNLEAEFNRLTQRYFDCLSSSDDEIAVEYPFQNPSPKKQKNDKCHKSENENKRKRKRDSSCDEEEEEEEEELLKDLQKPDKKISKEKVQKEEKKSHKSKLRDFDVDSELSNSSLSDFVKSYLKKKKRKLKNSKKRHKEKHSSKKNKERRKHSKHISKKLKKKRNSPRSSIESNEQSENCSLVHESKEAVFTNQLDTSTDAVFYKDKYDEIKERRRGSFKSNMDNAMYTSKEKEKSKANLLMPDKNKNSKLKETIEKLKAKSEKNNISSALFDDYCRSNTNSHKRVKKNYDDSKDFSKTDQSRKKMDEYEFTDDMDSTSENKSEKTNTKKTNTKKQLSSQMVNSKNESATEALEQAAKVFYKLFDETPSKHSEYNSNSNSPSHMPDEYVPFSLRDEDLLTNQQDKEKTSFIKSNKKRLVNKELMSKAMSRKKEVQRTIERLQPGKTKGNLISNVQSILKQEDSNSMNSIIKTKEPKNTLLVKPDDTESPKLSLGTVLDSVGFGMEKQHNFTNESTADRASAGKVQVVDTGTMTCDSEDTIASDKTATKPILEAVDVEPPKKDDETTKPLSLNPSQEKATPNLSAWFKAFGAPKSGTSKKKPDESDQDDSKSNDTTSDGKTTNIDNPKNNDPVSIDEVSTTEGGESPIPSLMTGSRIRRTSTGSSISERSSFSQDLDSPRHQPSHTSPVIRSPASPRTDDQKNLYPPINGTVRVGFYQDTASTKSSPEKSCSPRDAPQSPYASYSQHVYAVSSNAAQIVNQTNNFNDSSNKSPLPPYGPPYYDTAKTSHTNKAIRSQDDYSMYGTDSPIYKPPPSPLPSSYSPVHSTYSQHSQHSPYSHVQPSPQSFGQLSSTNSVSQSYETKHTEKTSIFPVKKRSYTEIQIPDTTTDLRVKSPPSKKISESEQKSNDKSDLGILGNIPISYDTKGISMSSPNYFHNNSTSVIMSATSSNVQKLQYPISECATPLAYDSPKTIDNPLQSLRANKDLNAGLRDSERSIQHSDINQAQHSIIKKQYDYNPLSALKSSSYENPTDMSKHSQSLTLDLKTPSYMGTDLSPSSKSLELDYSTKAIDASNNKTISADLMSVGYQLTENSSAESKLSCMNSKMDTCSALNKSHRGYDIYNMVTMANASYPGMLDLNSSQSIAKNILETNEANQRFVLEKLNPALQYQNLSQDLNKHISDDLINESLKKRSDHLSKQSYGESSNMASNDNYTKNLSLSHQNLSDWKLDCSKNTDPCIYNTYRSMTESNKSSISDNLYNSSNMCETDNAISKSQTELRIPMCGVIEIPSHKADHYHTSQAEFSTRTKNVMSLHANKPGDNIFTQLSPNAYKATTCHSPLSMDPTLRNLSGLPQMIERFKEDRLLSNFQASNASSYEKSIPLAHLYPKNVHNNLHSGNNAANQIFTAPLPMTFNRESLYLSNIQPPLHNLPPIDPPILQELSDKKARGRKKKPTTEVTSASTSGTSQQYHAYSGLKSLQSSKTEQTPLSMKTSNIVPGSAFNFGPPGSVGLPSDLYLEQFRNSSANFNIATNYIAAVQRSNPETVDKCAKSDHQPSVHTAPNLYSFLAHPQVRPGYPFLGVDPASPLYNQFLQQHQEQLFRSPSSQMMGILPTAYQTALRQPYDTITRPPWL